MRVLLSVPLLALVLLAYLLLTRSGSMMQPDSTLYDTVLPSGDELFLLVGDLFVGTGAVALLLKILRAAQVGGPRLHDHLLSLGTLVFAAATFLLVPGCGTSSFFLLGVFALVDVLAGWGAAAIWSRRQ